MRKRPFRVLAFVAGCAAAAVAAVSFGQAEEFAVNYVVATERLHTSGQPDSAQLATLSDSGFDLVINLATPASQNTVPEEGQLVTQSGAVYVNIPVDWRAPTYDDFEFFSGIQSHFPHLP